jgi:hypothetical protein
MVKGNRTMVNEEDNKHPTTDKDEHGSDGLDQPADKSNGSVIGLVEKFVDGDWRTGGLPSDPKRRLVAVETDTILRRWYETRVVEEIKAKPLPDLDNLNIAIPKSDWEVDLNGDPSPPWERAHIVYVLDLDTAERTTFISATKGAAVAVSRLKDKVAWMRRLRGANVVPLVELTWAPLPTRYGMRKRPEFKVIGWVDLSSGGGSLPPASGPKQLPPIEPKKVEELSIREDLDDDRRFE